MAVFFCSTDNELYLTGVQLEIGSQATPFEHRSFGEELALCQRYYFQEHGGVCETTWLCTVAIFIYNSSLRWKVQMRAAPTISGIVQVGVAES